MRAFFQCFIAALVLGLTGCAQLPMSDPVKISLVGIEQLPGQGLELRMAVKLRVQNPNDAALDYNGVALDIELRGLSFASGVSDEQGTVPRFGETVLVVPVSVSAISVLRQALGFANGDRSNVGYAISGKMGGSLLGGARFKSTGQIDLPTSLLGPPSR